MTLIALLSGKGGSGKSTVAVGLASLIAQDGQRVTLLDLDPQAGASDFLGLDPSTDPTTDEPVGAHGLTVYRGGRPLANASETQVAVHIERAVRAGGVVVADLSPAWTDTAHRALLARTDPTLVLAVRLDGGGLRAARELTQLAERRGLPVRIVPTFARRWTVAVTVLSSLRDFYGSTVTEAVIPDDVKAAESAVAKVPLPIYAPRARAAQALAELVAELTPSPSRQ